MDSCSRKHGETSLERMGIMVQEREGLAFSAIWTGAAKRALHPGVLFMNLDILLYLTTFFLPHIPVTYAIMLFLQPAVLETGQRRSLLHVYRTVGFDMGAMMPCLMMTLGLVTSWKVSFVCHSGPSGSRIERSY